MSLEQGIIAYPLIKSEDGSTWQLRIRLRTAKGDFVQLDSQSADQVLVQKRPSVAILAEIITDKTSKLGKAYKKTDPVLIASGVNIGKANETTTLQQALIKANKMHEKALKSQDSKPSTSQPADEPQCANEEHKHEETADVQPKRSEQEQLQEQAQQEIPQEQIQFIQPMLLGLYQYDSANAVEQKERGRVAQSQSSMFPCYVQRKYDGLRCCAFFSQALGRMVLQSRGQCEFTNLSHLQQQLLRIREELMQVQGSSLFFDGELYIHGQSLQQLNSVIRSQDSDSSCIKMHVFDIAVLNPSDQEDLPFSQRLQLLQRVQTIAQQLQLDSVVVVESQSVQDHAQCKQLLDTYVGEGYEGAVLRSADSKYVFSVKNRRSNSTLKYKKRLDMEVFIDSYSEGNGRDSGAIIYSCRLPNSPNLSTFNVVMNVPSESRKLQFKFLNEHASALQLLKTIPLQIEYAGLSSKGLPQQPRGIRFRYDLLPTLGVQYKMLSQVFK